MNFTKTNIEPYGDAFWAVKKLHYALHSSLNLERYSIGCRKEEPEYSLKKTSNFAPPFGKINSWGELAEKIIPGTLVDPVLRAKRSSSPRIITHHLGAGSFVVIY
jgi:hypothetical protein